MFQHDYGLADRLLHSLALGMRSMAELSFDIDQKACGADRSAEQVARAPHVFVAGLARAGTTTILRHLHSTGHFRSLTYRDMPFPLAPNMWKRLSVGWRQQRQESPRVHGDGIAVNADSPEALEELFWRIFSASDYIRPDGLLPHDPDDRVMALFQRYVAAILASAEGAPTRYLSKNNNNILRLPALQARFPAALFLIPFRDPATHALSLWRQHQNFCALQTRSPFVRSYMDWLVHHEFGLGHRPFLMGGSARSGLSPDTPDYWLDVWIRVYRHLATQSRKGRIFICYEDLCADPRIWNRLLDQLALPPTTPSQFRLGSAPQPHHFDPAKRAEAVTLYRELRAIATGPATPQASPRAQRPAAIATVP